MSELKIEKMRENAVVPTYGTDDAAGMDLYAAISEKIVLNPNETKLRPTGIKMAIPKGYGGFIYARSGLATKKGLAPANKVGVVDADYRGEVMVALHNHSTEIQEIDVKERIAQMVIAPYLKVDFKVVDKIDEDTVRGSKGFGSTGTK